MLTEMQEREIAFYEAEQRCCDLADAILNLFVERQLNVFDSLQALKKVKRTIKASVRSTNWNSPLYCKQASNEAPVFDSKIVAEINRRKG